MRTAGRVYSFVNANSKALKFLALFAAIFAITYFIFGIAPGVRRGLVQPYTVFLADAVAAVLNLFGEGARTDGATVISSRFSISIAMGCDGVEPMCLFMAGVLAYPASWRARLVGLALGVPVIHLINLARLIMLYYAGVMMPSVIDEIHVYVAQTIVILLSTAILIFWLDRFAVKPGRT
ncbi:MAG TPA: exosortase H [Blastocatellia bacterium]|jgi:exosortase H (IPTLxxWG-CTERM-specific)